MHPSARIVVVVVVAARGGVVIIAETAAADLRWLSSLQRIFMTHISRT
jgi:hypothetical protein